MKILITSKQALGHIIASLELGTQLLKRGHSVIMMTSQSQEQFIQIHGLDFLPTQWDMHLDQDIEEMLGDCCIV